MASNSDIETDVLVIGGGTSGIASAIAAARTGARTTLVERYGFLGGVANVGLCLHTFHSSKAERIVAGIPWEMINRMKDLGGSTGPVRLKNAHMETTTPIDPPTLQWVAQEMITESGGEVLYHTMPTDILIEDGVVRGVAIRNKSGTKNIRARVVIDSTGDGDIATWAGAPYEKGRKSDGKMQRMSLVFRMGGVDVPQMLEAIGIGGAWHPLPLSGKKYPVWWSSSFKDYAPQVEAEELFLRPDDQFWGNTVREGEANLNASRIQGLDGTVGEQLSQAEIIGKRQVHQLIAFMRKYISGCEDAYLIATAPFMGVRETRRIIGEYQLTGEDVLNGRKFEDGIAKAGYPIDIHDPTSGKTTFQPIRGEDGAYDIPYRCLIPKNVDGLLLAGRCISTTHEAMASTRVMITGMTVGQATGTAAGMAAQRGIQPRALPVDELRSALINQGAHLELGPVPGSEHELLISS